ncbi:tRNA pseudouridine synthase A [Rodentibacter pneumotropicus]|uniref:tRNA pseudouridine synthase A n=1 Tax=Rodentibacter pneumotropicus TaxID=758 RepID=A0A3S4U961_9PAST|nr:tRNA pseudouridine synthase A [Rodentibacter pneumotropicus]
MKNTKDDSLVFFMESEVEMKIALGIEYNGQHYFGWQRQEKLRTVQEELEKPCLL